MTQHHSQQDLLKQDERLLHPFTDPTTKDRLIIERGDGVWLYDTEGNRYLDGVGGLWCMGVGYGEERLIQAAEKQMRKLPFQHLFAKRSHAPAIQLAQEILHMLPFPFEKVFFGLSGSDANDTAIKIIWHYNNAKGRPQKKKIIAREQAYHGVGIGSGSLTGLASIKERFDLPIDRILHTDFPHYYLNHKEGETEEQYTDRLIQNIEKLIEKEGADTIAAFFAEPIMGSGGVVFPPKGYFEKLSKVLKKHDILFVSDEVICGFGRTGKMFGIEHFGITPDIMSFAKGLSSGYLPISATVITKEISDVICESGGELGTFGHGHTYTGHPVSAAVALEALKIYQERDITSHVLEVAPILAEGLQDVADHPLVGHVRSIGLLGGLELIQDKEKRQHFPKKPNISLIIGDMVQKAGAIVRPMGNTIAFSPALSITKDELKILMDCFKEGLDDAYTFLKKENIV